MKGVAGKAISRKLAVDLGAAGLGVLQGLQHHDARAFAQNKSITVFVKGTAGVFGVVIARGERLEAAESGHGHGGDHRFGAAHHHHIGHRPSEGA